MGRDKAGLPFGDETLLQRVVRIVDGMAETAHTVVIAAAAQHLPLLPAEVQIVRDERNDAGPLPAMVMGLNALADAVDLAIVVACDCPLVTPVAVRFLFDQLAAAPSDQMASVPRVDGRWHPLVAAYRVAAAVPLEQLAEAGERSLQRALDQMNVVPIDEAALRQVDPALALLANCNTPADYQAALAAAGLAADEPDR